MEEAVRKLIVLVGVAVTAGTALIAQGPPRPGPDVYGELRWRYVGPEGNRISAVAGVPGDPPVYYARSAAGGIAKTTDGGVHRQQNFRHPPAPPLRPPPP